MLPKIVCKGSMAWAHIYSINWAPYNVPGVVLKHWEYNGWNRKTHVPMLLKIHFSAGNGHKATNKVIPHCSKCYRRNWISTGAIIAP